MRRIWPRRSTTSGAWSPSIPREDSYMFHFPNLRWTTLQARTMKIPQIVVPTEGEKEVELQDLSKALRMAKVESRVEAIFTGALASVYQKSRVSQRVL